MKYFKDKTGKEYKIELTIGSIKKIKSKLDIDLLDIEGGETPLIQKLLVDELLLAEIIAVLIEDQLPENEKDVLDNFDGASITNATKAFFDEYKVFFTERGRKDKAEIVSKAIWMMETLVSRAEQEIQKIDLEKIIQDESISGN